MGKIASSPPGWCSAPAGSAGAFERELDRLQLLLGDELDEGPLDDPGVDLEELRRLGDQLIAGLVGVSRLVRLAEGVQHPGAGALGRVGGDAEVAGDAVGGLEADAVDVARQAVGVGAHPGDRLGAVELVDLDRVGGAHPVALEEDHHLLDPPLLLPGVADPRHPHRADALDLGEALGLAVDHLQGLEAEVPHQAPRHLGADPLDQSRSPGTSRCRRRSRA